MHVPLVNIGTSSITGISIVDAPDITEGEDAIFRVNLTDTYVNEITVDYLINTDSATADDLDVPALKGKLTIPANVPYGEIVIPTKDDNDYEM